MGSVRFVQHFSTSFNRGWSFMHCPSSIIASIFHVAAYLPPLVTFATLLYVYLYIACWVCCFGTLYLTVWPLMYFMPTTLVYHRAISLLLDAVSLFTLALPGSTSFLCCRITRSVPFGVTVSGSLFSLCSCTQFHAICFPIIVFIASTITMSPSQFILKISFFFGFYCNLVLLHPLG